MYFSLLDYNRLFNSFSQFQTILYPSNQMNKIDIIVHSVTHYSFCFLSNYFLKNHILKKYVERMKFCDCENYVGWCGLYFTQRLANIWSCDFSSGLRRPQSVHPVWCNPMTTVILKASQLELDFCFKGTIKHYLTTK
jgi:hypothetical protein